MFYFLDNGTKDPLINNEGFAISERYIICVDLYDTINGEHRTGVWEKDTLKCTQGQFADLKYYKTVFVKKEDLNWLLLPSNCESIVGLKNDKCTGLSGSYGFRYSQEEDIVFLDLVMSSMDISDDYGIRIIDLKPGETIKRPEDQVEKFDPIASAREAGNTVCSCGSRITEPFIWNGEFLGFKCSTCYSDMAYDLLG